MLLLYSLWISMSMKGNNDGFRHQLPSCHLSSAALMVAVTLMIRWGYTERRVTSDPFGPEFDSSAMHGRFFRSWQWIYHMTVSWSLYTERTKFKWSPRSWNVDGRMESQDANVFTSSCRSSFSPSVDQRALQVNFPVIISFYSSRSSIRELAPWRSRFLHINPLLHKSDEIGTDPSFM